MQQVQRRVRILHSEALRRTCMHVLHQHRGMDLRVHCTNATQDEKRFGQTVEYFRSCGILEWGTHRQNAASSSFAFARATTPLTGRSFASVPVIGAAD
jgi:hypothetical protein